MSTTGFEKRIAAIYAEAARRAEKKRSAYEERQRKGSAGLPPSAFPRARTGSVISRAPSRRTTGKHNAH